MTNRLLTAAEVADILQVSVARVYELARQRVIPCVRLVRQVRFDEQAMREWIAQGGSAQSNQT
jgi:excisionase family DNA binding protein